MKIELLKSAGLLSFTREKRLVCTGPIQRPQGPYRIILYFVKDLARVQVVRYKNCRKGPEKRIGYASLHWRKNVRSTQLFNESGPNFTAR